MKNRAMTADRRRYIQIRTCTRKRPFRSPDEATAATGAPRAYRCPFCGKYHATHHVA